MQTIGTFQAYLVTHQLAQYAEAKVGWIFGLYLFMAYSCSIQWGPIFDAVGPRHLSAVGSICLVASMFSLGGCRRKYRNADSCSMHPVTPSWDLTNVHCCNRYDRPLVYYPPWVCNRYCELRGITGWNLLPLDVILAFHFRRFRLGN